ncbi:DUF2382 domain-containing protein [Massilia yuzhufengensis]|uniref:DUF2382 domain-containing protein n=1 Tax=Massilia yuzhufengensis TaxID=1164594 RepID=A0A1I1QWR0_9BURK|nr:DUF2382 domain-containing protein [Massilia yuzhufengensis]SFD26584.1 protein of unknown function [Massilia yuzhufengensis]
MQHTLVAVFDNLADAQSALDELLASGFTRENVRMSGSSGATAAGSTASSASSPDTDTGFGSGIKNFFSDLFGDDDSVDQVNRYEGAVTRGQHVVTLTADSLPEVERAADIVERFGPTDIDEHSSGSGQVGTAGALLSGSQSGMSASPISAQSGQTSLSQQRDTATQGIPVVEEQLKIGKREVQRGGVRIFSRVVETRVNQSVGVRDDTYYRNHFQNTYGTGGGSYDDYAPAYGYGTHMRSQFAGRQWGDVEGSLRSDWETRNAGGASTWEKVKAAVRHGWDRMTD